MPRQLDMLPKPKRKPPRVLMRVCDAGGSRKNPLCRFKCATCGYESGWLRFENVTESALKRGLPCPRCN